MTDVDPRPITADSLRAREEWRAFPGAVTIWEQTADEGEGIGYDGLDPSAMLRAFFATASTWAEVLGWYRSVLEPLGWQGREVKPFTWWEWTSSERPKERIDMLDRGQWREWPGWRLPKGRVGQLGFEVLFTASSGFSATMRPRNA